jgi:hypothetical protein
MIRASVHTIPAERQTEHVTEGLMCWCVPRFYLPCDGCDNGCWKCDRGLIELTVAEAQTAADPLVIVHNR